MKRPYVRVTQFIFSSLCQIGRRVIQSFGHGQECSNWKSRNTFVVIRLDSDWKGKFKCHTYIVVYHFVGCTRVHGWGRDCWARGEADWWLILGRRRKFGWAFLSSANEIMEPKLNDIDPCFTAAYVCFPFDAIHRKFWFQLLSLHFSFIIIFGYFYSFCFVLFFFLFMKWNTV